MRRVAASLLLVGALVAPPASAQFVKDLPLALGVTALDWMQTRSIATTTVPGYCPDNAGGTCYKHREMNPLLPRHPSVSQVNRHFLVGALVLTGLAYTLPEQWARHLLRGYIILETLVVARNVAIG